MSEIQPIKKSCPYCAEDIMYDAILCRYCGKDIRPKPTVWKSIGEIVVWVILATIVGIGAGRGSDSIFGGTDFGIIIGAMLSNIASFATIIYGISEAKKENKTFVSTVLIIIACSLALALLILLFAWIAY